MVQIAVIGAGDWGKNHIRTFAQLPDSQLSAVCDLDPARLKYVQANYPQVKTTTQIKEIMNDQAIEAVVIASSAVSHYALTQMALMANKDEGGTGEQGTHPMPYNPQFCLYPRRLVRNLGHR